MEKFNAEHIANLLEVEIGFSDGKFTKIEVSALKDALALINLQEQRIKELTEENERLKTDLKIRNMKRASIFEIADAFDRGRTAGVRKMRELIYERLDISVEGYSSEEVKSDVRDMVYQIAKEMLEGEK